MQADHLVGAGGHTMRRIIYTDPCDDKTYTYITNELKLPAFALVLIYKHRWDQEKIFYQLKVNFMSVNLGLVRTKPSKRMQFLNA